MNNLDHPILIFGFLLIVLILHARPAIAQEVENQKEFDYVQGSGKGPDKWGELHKEWASCKKGDMQSPIDLSNKRVEMVPKSEKLKWNYKPSNATLMNRGHDISLKWEGNAGSVQINGTDYMFQQCHWHSPSEHTINGKSFDLELHMVHLSSDNRSANKIAVVGIMYNIGQPDTFLSELKDQIWSISDKKEGINVGVIDPRHIKIGGKKYYGYIGSLTTPPCSEGVIWTINKRVRTVSRQEVELLRIAVHDSAEKNARPLQPLNKRDIHLYRLRHHKDNLNN